MRKSELVRLANIIGKPYGLKANIIGSIKSTGVQGDQRTRTFVILLRGEFPGHETLERVSKEISNTLPINRVMFEIVAKK